MPSLRLYGRTFHLASDSLPWLGGVLLLPATVLLVTYSVFLGLYLDVPGPDCPGSHATIRNSVIWGTLAIAAANFAGAAAMVAIGLRGEAPLLAAAAWRCLPLPGAACRCLPMPTTACFACYRSILGWLPPCLLQARPSSRARGG